MKQIAKQLVAFVLDHIRDHYSYKWVRTKDERYLDRYWTFSELSHRHTKLS